MSQVDFKTSSFNNWKDIFNDGTFDESDTIALQQIDADIETGTGLTDILSDLEKLKKISDSQEIDKRIEHVKTLISKISITGDSKAKSVVFTPDQAKALGFTKPDGSGDVDALDKAITAAAQQQGSSKDQIDGRATNIRENLHLISEDGKAAELFVSASKAGIFDVLVLISNDTLTKEKVLEKLNNKNIKPATEANIGTIAGKIKTGKDAEVKEFLRLCYNQEDPGAYQFAKIMSTLSPEKAKLAEASYQKILQAVRDQAYGKITSEQYKDILNNEIENLVKLGVDRETAAEAILTTTQDTKEELRKEAIETGNLAILNRLNATDQVDLDLAKKYGLTKLITRITSNIQITQKSINAITAKTEAERSQALGFSANGATTTKASAKAQITATTNKLDKSTSELAKDRLEALKAEVSQLEAQIIENNTAANKLLNQQIEQKAKTKIVALKQLEATVATLKAAVASIEQATLSDEAREKALDAVRALSDQAGKINQHNTQVMAKAGKLSEQLATQPQQTKIVTDKLNKQLNELKMTAEKKLIDTLAEAYTALSEPIFASGVIKEISKHFEIVTQAYKTAQESAALQKKTQAANAQKTEQLARDFAKMVMSNGERIVSGFITLAEYKEKQKQLMRGYIEEAMTKADQEKVESRNLHLSERTLKELAADIASKQPQAMLTALEKLSPADRKIVMDAIKEKLKDMPVEQLLQLATSGGLPPELKNTVLEVLKQKAKNDPALAQKLVKQFPELAAMSAS